MDKYWILIHFWTFNHFLFWSFINFDPIEDFDPIEIWTPQKQIQDESIFDFVARRFGPDVAQYAIDPMVRGICAGDAKSISAKSFVAGPMFNLEQNYGSVFRGMLKRKLKGESPKIVPSKSVSIVFQQVLDTIRYVFYKYVFSISKIAFESFLDNCLKAMPTFMQLFSYLLNKLLHKVNCIISRHFFLAVSKKWLVNNFNDLDQ